MTKPITRIFGWGLTLLLSAYTILLSAQPEEESIYSDQAYDPVDNPAWYESPFLWIGLVVILAILLLLLRRRRRPSRKFMDSGKEE